jgi:hypothetical protein
MQNERSGARRQRKSKGEGEVLSPAEAAKRLRGRDLKRYLRAAAALNELYDDTTLADAIGVGRGALDGWWTGAQMKPDNIREAAKVTGLSPEGLTQFLYFGGPPPKLPTPSGPAGLQEGVRRAEERRDDEGPDTPARSPGPLPPDGGAGHE